MSNMPHGWAERKWVLISEVAKTFGKSNPDEENVFSVRTLRRWCEEGRIPASKRGGSRWWIDLHELTKIRDEYAAKEDSLMDDMLTGGHNRYGEDDV